MLQSKHRGWLNVYVKKTHIYTVYKRITSELVTQQTETEGIKQMVFYTNETKKKLWVAILTAEKINFKAKTELRDKEGQNNDTGINPRRTYNIHKYICMHVCMYVCIQHRNTKCIRKY